MKVQLLVNLCVCRECFLMEDFIGSDDIFALVKSGSFCFESKDGSYTVCENEAARAAFARYYHRTNGFWAKVIRRIKRTLKGDFGA